MELGQLINSMAGGLTTKEQRIAASNIAGSQSSARLRRRQADPMAGQRRRRTRPKPLPTRPPTSSRESKPLDTEDKMQQAKTRLHDQQTQVRVARQAEESQQAEKGAEEQERGKVAAASGASSNVAAQAQSRAAKQEAIGSRKFKEWRKSKISDLFESLLGGVDLADVGITALISLAWSVLRFLRTFLIKSADGLMGAIAKKIAKYRGWQMGISCAIIAVTLGSLLFVAFMAAAAIVVFMMGVEAAVGWLPESIQGVLKPLLGIPDIPVSE